MEQYPFTVPVLDGYTEPRLTLTVILAKNKEGKTVMQVNNSTLLTTETFPKLISAVIGSYIIDMRGLNLIADKDVEEMEAKILDEVSSLITTMKPEITIDKPETP